jgi:hypothetical protein
MFHLRKFKIMNTILLFPSIYNSTEKEIDKEEPLKERRKARYLA